MPALASSVLSINDITPDPSINLNRSVVVSVYDGAPTTDCLTETLRAFWLSRWMWKARRLSSSSFVVEFPSEELLFSTCNGPPLCFDGSFSASFKRWSHDAASIAVRRPNAVWVAIEGLPLDCRHKETIEKILKGFGSVLFSTPCSSESMDLREVVVLLECQTSTLPTELDLYLVDDPDGDTVHRIKLEIIQEMPVATTQSVNQADKDLLNNRPRQFPPPTPFPFLGRRRSSPQMQTTRNHRPNEVIPNRHAIGEAGPSIEMALCYNSSDHRSKDRLQNDKTDDNSNSNPKRKREIGSDIF